MKSPSSAARSRVLLATLMSLPPAQAMAADTVETWEVGATDVDFYLGYGGIGLRGGERTAFGDMMLGYGIVRGFSAYVGTTLKGDGHLASGQAEPYIGVYGTLVDTDHFDLDLFLRVATTMGAADSTIAVAPSAELNFDVEPDRSSWGAYVRAGVSVFGHEPIPGEPRTAAHVETTLGTYLTVEDGHQVLLEWDVTWHPDADIAQHPTELGGLALGYNVTLDPAAELITQVYLDVPQSGESLAAGVMVGFIATLPSGQTARESRGETPPVESAGRRREAFAKSSRPWPRVGSARGDGFTRVSGLAR